VLADLRAKQARRKPVIVARGLEPMYGFNVID
jgi:hypothetical protein